MRTQSPAVDGARTLQSALRRERRLGAVVDTHHRTHELMLAGAPAAEILGELVSGVEQQSDGLLGAVLLAGDPGHRARLGAAPRLPPNLWRALPAIDLGDPAAGDAWCDVRGDERWRPLREAASARGLVACRTVALRDGAGHARGAFVLFGDRARAATPCEIEALTGAARLAAIALGFGRSRAGPRCRRRRARRGRAAARHRRAQRGRRAHRQRRVRGRAAGRGERSGRGRAGGAAARVGAHADHRLDRLAVRRIGDRRHRAGPGRRRHRGHAARRRRPAAAAGRGSSSPVRSRPARSPSGSPPSGPLPSGPWRCDGQPARRPLTIRL